MTPARSPLVVVGAAMVVAFTVVAVFAPLLAPYDPRALSGESLEPPSANHLLGTDNLGRDLLSQLVWGARSSLAIAIGVPACALAIAVSVGTAAGLLGGVVDRVLMRIVDMYLSVPLLPLLILVTASVRQTLVVTTVVLALLMWPFQARVLRGQTMSVRRRGFIAAARGLGKGRLYIVRRHLVPALAPLIVAGFITVASIAIPLQAGLALLGLGDPNGVSWGNMLNRAYAHRGLYLTPVWTWWVLPAGFAITLAMLGFTFVGVGLEPRINPRSGPEK